MKPQRVKDCCLIVKPFGMRRMYFLLLAGLLAFSQLSCAPREARETIVSKYENGQPRVVQQTGTKSSEIIELHYYASGKVHMQGPIVDGQRHGLWKSWYEDGILWSEGSFEQGLRHGKGVVYHPGGLKHIEGEYENGKKTGIWQAWDETGILVSTTDYTSE